MGDAAAVSAGGRTVGAWALSHRIGSGSFAVVWKAVHQSSGATAAVKEVYTQKLNKKLQESLESEMSILSRARHPNIVQLLEIIKEPERGRIYLVMEYCAGGDLSSLLRRVTSLSEPVIHSYMRQLAAGLRELRSLNLIHRDLKPQNLLLSGPEPNAVLKIGDFGFARNLQPEGMAETLCGSPLYMAPEILQFHRYDAKADLWSVGAILFEMIAGQTPFNGRNHVELLRNIEKSEAKLPAAASGNVSFNCQQLVASLLKRNPVERIGFEEFFNHPFLAPPHSYPAVPTGSGSTGVVQNTASSVEQLKSFLEDDTQTVSSSLPVSTCMPMTQHYAAPMMPMAGPVIQIIPANMVQPMHIQHVPVQMQLPQQQQDDNDFPCYPPLPTHVPTPMATNIFAPGSLPLIPVAAIWDAISGGQGRAQNAVNAADQASKQFSQSPPSHCFVEMNASAGSMSGSFERDCVVISAVQPINIPKASENSSGTALVGRAESMDVAKSAPASCPISRPPRPPMSHGAPKLAAAQTMTQASQQTSNMTYTSPANQAADAESAASSQPQQLSRAACLRLSAHLLLELAASKSKDGANKEGLVLSVLALQGLSVTVSLCADRGGPEADLSSVEIMKLMGSVLADTQEVAQSLNLSDLSTALTTELPCPFEMAYRLALDYGRAAAVNELMGNSTRCIYEYNSAMALLMFLLYEVPRLPKSGLIPVNSIGRALPESDKQRLLKYLQKIQLRISACAARSAAMPSQSGAGNDRSIA